MSCVADDLAGKCTNCVCNKRVVAVIPCYGRFPLLKFNVSRLYAVNGIYKVILVGHEKEVEGIAEETNSVFISHANKPLGAKWNAGFREAEELNPDAALFVGSSDLISTEWIKTGLRYLNDYDMVGKLGCHFMDINTQTGKRLVHWPGYLKGTRKDEPIGIGRIISARILEKMGWEPFDRTKDHSMDAQMHSKVLDNGGSVKSFEDDVHAMSISTNLWNNLHKFNMHWDNILPSTKIHGDDMNEFINKYFPDIENLKL